MATQTEEEKKTATDKAAADKKAADAAKAKTATSITLDRTYTYEGRKYGPGEVSVGTGGPEAGEIEAEAIPNLQAAMDRARSRDEVFESQKLGIDEREDERRKQVRRESGERV